MDLPLAGVVPHSHVGEVVLGAINNVPPKRRGVPGVTQAFRAAREDLEHCKIYYPSVPEMEVSWNLPFGHFRAPLSVSYNL